MKQSESRKLCFYNRTSLRLSLLRVEGSDGLYKESHMEIVAEMALPIAAAGYSLVYLLAGGGLGGAILIFIIAKMLGR